MNKVKTLYESLWLCGIKKNNCTLFSKWLSQYRVVHWSKWWNVGGVRRFKGWALVKVRFHRCATQCDSVLHTVLNIVYLCACGNGRANSNKLYVNNWEKCAHSSEHVCAFSTHMICAQLSMCTLGRTRLLSPRTQSQSDWWLKLATDGHWATRS